MSLQSSRAFERQIFDVAVITIVQNLYDSFKNKKMSILSLGFFFMLIFASDNKSVLS